MSQYHMFRQDLLISDINKLKRILKNGKYITLALCKDNEPYVVTLSYGYDEHHNSLYMHCAARGLKLEFIESNPLVCGTVIDDQGYLDGQCDHAYNSLVVRGKLTRLTDVVKTKEALKTLISHLENAPAERLARINNMNPDSIAKLTVFELPIESLEGRHSRKK